MLLSASYLFTSASNVKKDARHIDIFDIGHSPFLSLLGLIVHRECSSSFPKPPSYAKKSHERLPNIMEHSASEQANAASPLGACALRETSSAGDEDKRKSRMPGNGR